LTWAFGIDTDFRTEVIVGKIIETIEDPIFYPVKFPEGNTPWAFINIKLVPK